MKIDGGPAFPGTKLDELGVKTIPTEGMCLRDYFAVRALGSIVAADGVWRFDDGADARAKQAVLAYQYADALLKAREM